MSVRLTWDDINPGEDGFRVYRSTASMDPNALPAALATLPADSVDYVDDTVSSNTEYFYRVSVYKGSFEVVSDEVSVTTSTGTFHPSQLFGVGDYGTLAIAGQSALYQDEAGTIPVTAQSDPVQHMSDLSGNGVSFKASSAIAPIYDEAKGYPNIYFDGSNALLTDTLTSNILAGGEGFVLFCGYTDYFGSTSIGIVEEGILNFDDYRIYLAFDGRSTKKRLFAYSPDGANRYIDADTEIQSADSYVLAVNGDAGSWLAYKNDVEQSGGITSSATISGSSRLSIGRQTRDNGSLHLTGGMVGVLAIDRHLTPAELASTLSYFAGLVV